MLSGEMQLDRGATLIRNHVEFDNLKLVIANDATIIRNASQSRDMRTGRPSQRECNGMTSVDHSDMKYRRTTLRANDASSFKAVEEHW